MNKANATLIVVLFCFSLIPATRLLAEDKVEIVAGELSYFPQPDISICFCGSFKLVPQTGDRAYFLISESVDLSELIGARVTAYGKAYTAICQGTLARNCSYFNVEKIVSFSRTGTAAVDWALLKIIYH